MSDQSFSRKEPNQSLNPGHQESNQNNDPGRNSRLTFAISIIVLACLAFIVIVILIVRYDKQQRVKNIEPLVINTNKHKSEEQDKDRVKPKEKSNNSNNNQNRNAGNLEELIEQVKPSIVLIKSQKLDKNGEGSGFIISDDGYILTCYHVIDSAIKILVRYLNSDDNYEMAPARLVWGQKDIDVALISLQQSVNIKSIEMGDAESVMQGHQIIAIGFPLGSSLGVEPTATKGIVSSLRLLDTRSLFQIDAPVNSGSSGGALISFETGKAIGVVNAKIKEAEGVGFAIKITDDLKHTLNEKSGYNLNNIIGY